LSDYTLRKLTICVTQAQTEVYATLAGHFEGVEGSVQAAKENQTIIDCW